MRLQGDPGLCRRPGSCPRSTALDGLVWGSSAPGRDGAAPRGGWTRQGVQMPRDGGRGVWGPTGTWVASSGHSVPTGLLPGKRRGRAPGQTPQGRPRGGGPNQEVTSYKLQGSSHCFPPTLWPGASSKLSSAAENRSWAPGRLAPGPSWAGGCSGASRVGAPPALPPSHCGPRGRLCPGWELGAGGSVGGSWCTFSCCGFWDNLGGY